MPTLNTCLAVCCQHLCLIACELHHNSCYKFFNTALNWTSARNGCISQSGDLTSVTSMEENEFVSQLSDDVVWLGLIAVDEGRVTWSDGSRNSPFNYPWAQDEPEKRNNTCYAMLQSGSWKSVSCNAALPYVCKKGIDRELESVGVCEGVFVAYRCDSLQAPLHGSIASHNFSVGSAATFSCDEGFRLAGASDVKCQSNSQWSDNPPVCESETSVMKHHTVNF